MLRAIAVYTFLFTFLVICIPIYIIEWLLNKIYPKARHESSRCIIVWAFKVCLKISGVTIDATGMENIPKDKACLFVSNHIGIYDVLVSYVTINKVMGFIAKKETKKVPLLSFWMQNINCLFLDRDDIKQGLKVILTAIEYIKQGISIFVFPEGTRSKNGTMAPFKEGSLKIGTKTNCPIIPVAITGTSAIYEDDFPRIHSGHVTIDFGTPIIASELEKEEKKFIGAYTQQKIQDMLDLRLKKDNTSASNIS